MKKSLSEFEAFTSAVAEYLLKNLYYSPSSINDYRRDWRRVLFFLESKGYSHYTPDLEGLILDYILDGKPIDQLTPEGRRSRRGVKMLSEYLTTGKISLFPRPKKVHKELEGVVGKAVSGFLEFKRVEERLSRIRLSCYRRSLETFHTYCDQQKLNSLQRIDLPFLLQFINGLQSPYKTHVPIIISTMRGFMKYLFIQRMLDRDYSLLIPRYKSVDQSKLPSTYSEQEVQQVIAAVDRSTATGKRNYAIILLASRLGLRASDICRLKFDNLKWQISTIELKQHKTGKSIVLPLLAEVGNAIIDYLKYGRPSIDDPCVFLTARSPYSSFPSSNVVTHVVQRAFIAAGISIKDKRFGPHSLRHSLGFRMLQESTVLPVISEVFGHKDTESTRYYLRIDLTSMQNCMLEVPPVDTGFYHQKGGVFYG